MRRTDLILSLVFFLAACATTEPKSQAELYDLVIRGGTVVDGTGAAAFTADVAIEGDRILAVNPGGIDAAMADRVLDASGLIVAPGFIDQHAHVQTRIHQYPLAENFTRQGITTILASLHSGDQPWPFAEYLDSLEVVPNVGFFAGHTWTRKRVLGLENRAPTAAELEQMKGLVDQTMREGALGLSTGLLYVPANYAETEEIIELAKVAARHGGIYVSHMRDEATGLIDSVAETIRVAREAGLPGQIQHHKATGEPQWGSSRQTLDMIDQARAEGLDITLDVYPYTASSTGSSVLFPQWALADGREGIQKRLNDPQTREQIRKEMREIFLQKRTGTDISRVQFRTIPSMPRFQGMRLSDLALDRGLPVNVDTGIELVMELQLKGGFSAIYHSMQEEDLQRILRHPYAMIDTDGDPVSYGVGYPHPRSYGAFPRVLGRYVRELGVLTLEDAIRKMTSLSADQIGRPDMGRIASGMMADLTIFDAERIRDLATYTDPHRYSVGVQHLVINGVVVMEDAAYTGARPGRVLKGPARPAAVN